MIDDLTGDEGEDVETVTFGLDGDDYEIDLSEANATALRDAFVHYIARGRRLGRSRNSSGRPSQRGQASSNGARSNGHNSGRRVTLAPGIDSKAARDWARRQGLSVAERGRVPEGILDAYRKHVDSV